MFNKNGIFKFLTCFGILMMPLVSFSMNKTFSIKNFHVLFFVGKKYFGKDNGYTSYTGICSYDLKRDEEFIKKIALKCMPRLVSGYKKGENDDTYALRLWYEDIEPTLNDEEVIRKVYLLEDKPIGFINYTLDNKPFHRCWTNANIYHLAIGDNYRGQGCGTLLLQDALDDCKKNNIRKVTLLTTGTLENELDRFYGKLGFTITQRAKLGVTTKWKRIITPLNQMVALAFKKFKNNKKNM